MAVTVVENLVKEFKISIRNNNRGYNHRPPLPPLPKIEDYFEVYKIDGIPESGEGSDPYYSKLNGTVAYGLKRGQVPTKRKLKITGEVAKDYAGNVLREPVPVPRGKTAVVTSISLGLPYKYSTEEFEYVDFIETENRGKIERKYIYLIDEKYLYPYHQIALVYSNKKLSKTYANVKVQTWRNGVVYLSLIPYENNTYRKAEVLSVSMGNDFKNVIQEVLKTWIKTGFICEPSIFAESELGSEMIVKHLEGTIDPPTSPISYESVAEIKGKINFDEDSVLEFYNDN